jgi:hypothetical protein
MKRALCAALWVLAWSGSAFALDKELETDADEPAAPEQPGGWDGVSWTLGANVFAGAYYVRGPHDWRTTLTRVESFTYGPPFNNFVDTVGLKLSLRMVSWASLEYQWKALRIPQLVDATQISNRMRVSFNDQLARRKELPVTAPAAPPGPPNAVPAVKQAGSTKTGARARGSPGWGSYRHA